MMFSRRKDALKNGDKYYFTGKPCTNGHIAKRYTSAGRCTVCMIEYNIVNKEKIALSKKIYGRKNYEHLSVYKKQYREKHRESILKKEAGYRIRDKDRLKKYLSEYGPIYRKNNKDKVNHWASNRRASQLNRTPPWLSDDDKNKMLELYEKARLLTIETGIEHHVDHEIPLQGILVSGLHIPNNLQILTASENLSKSNRFEL